MKLRAGQQVASTVDSTTMIVVRAPASEVVLTCGGVEMVDPKKPPEGPGGVLDPAFTGGTLMGKRYADDGIGIELLCTKAGTGTVAVNGTPLELKQPKPLPASD